MSHLRQIRFAHDTTSAAFGHADGVVRVHTLDGAAGGRELVGLFSEITALSTGPLPGWWGAGSHAGGAAVWAPESDEPRYLLVHPERITHLSFDPAGTFLTVDAARRAHLWRCGERGCTPEMLEILGATRTVDGGAVDAGAGHWLLQIDFDWVTFDPHDRRVLRRFDGIDDSVFSYPDGVTRFAHDGRYLAFYWDELTVFDTSTGERVVELPRQHNPWSLQPADDAASFVLGTADGRLVVLDSSGRHRLDLPVSREGLVDVDLSRDGRLVSFVDFAGAGGVVEIASGELLLGSTGLRSSG